MKSLWKAVGRVIFHRVPTELTTGGTDARIEAERQLARTVAQTPYYAGLGRDLRVLRERNHIAERIRSSIREA